MDFIIETLGLRKGKILKRIIHPETVVKIPEDVTTLDADVFNDLQDVVEVYLPASLIDCSRFRSLLFRHQEMVHVHRDNPMYSSHDGIVYRKDYTEVLSCPMKKTGAYQLLPTTVSIAQQAFCGCNLSEIILNEGLKEIGEGAFCDSVNLEEIRIPSTVEKIGDEAFYMMMSGNIPIVVSKGGYAEFYAKCNDVPYRIERKEVINKRREEEWLRLIYGECLYSQYLGNSLIWELYSDGSLVIRGSGEIPDYVNHWQAYTGKNQAPWIGCEKYGIMPHRLVIMDGITRIGANAFESFGCLKEISLPYSLKSIGEMAFFDCFNVTTVYLPKNFNTDMLIPAELPLEYNKDYEINHGVMRKRV